MNMITEKELYCGTAQTDDVTEVSSVTLSDTWRIIIAALSGLLCAVSAVFIPLFPSTISEAINASAVSFAESLHFDRAFSGAVLLLSELCSGELYLTLFLLFSPAVIFGKRLIYAAVSMHTFFRAVCAASVFNASVGTYSAVTVLVSSSASVLFFVLSARLSLRFTDNIRKNTDNVSFSVTFNFLLKILSALGCFIVAEFLILLPSAFI